MSSPERPEDSQDVPEFPYARYADLLQLRGIRVETAAHVRAAWDEALAADRPVVIEAIVDRDAPLLPPFPAGKDKLDNVRAGLGREGTDGEHALALLEEQARQESRPQSRRPLAVR